MCLKVVDTRRQAVVAQLAPKLVGDPGVGSYSTEVRKVPFTVKLFPARLASCWPLTMLKGKPVL